MEWGDNWGEFWGGKIVELDDVVGDSHNRLILQWEDSANIKALLEVVADKFQELENITQDLFGAMRLDTSYGWILDSIGGILNLGRGAFSDDEYRLYLSVLAQFVLPNRKTVEGLLTATRALLNDDVRVIDYSETYPKAFTLVVNDVTDREIEVFPLILRLAKPATYNGVMSIVPAGAFGFDDATSTITVTKLGFDNASAPPTFGGDFGFVIPF